VVGVFRRFLSARGTVASPAVARRRAAASVVEPLEGRQLLAGNLAEMTGPLWYGPDGPVGAGPVEAARAPRGAALDAVPGDMTPTVTATRPANGAVQQPRVLFVAADVKIPSVGHGVDAASLDATTVKLLRTSDNAQVPANLNTSGGGDSIVLTPTVVLDALTQYTFVVTSGVRDTAGTPFAPYSSTFTTGTRTGNTLDPSVQFAQVQQPAAAGFKYTGVTIGPDGRLYAGTLDGRIVRFDIDDAGNLVAPLVIDTVNVNNGGSASLHTRTVTGIHFEPGSTATNLALWVSHGIHDETDAPNWTGKVSRLGGANLETYKDFVVGLPRSVRDHLTNQIDFGPDGALYVTQGSNTSTGAPDNAWGMRQESLMTGAVLRVDTKKITTAVDVKTEAGGTYDPFAANAPVTLYATGVRNGYDLVWHSNGSLYVPSNGGAAGGNAPGYDGTVPAPRRIDEPTEGPYDGTVVPALANIAATQSDFLFRVRKGGYYGHPNVTRGEYVLNGGNPTEGIDFGEVAGYPVGTQPDRNYRGFALEFGKSFSPDGIIEYRGDEFGGLLRGRLMVARYSGGDDIAIIEIDDQGRAVKVDTGIPGLIAFRDPLDLVEDRDTGNLYVVEHGASKITLAKPIPVGGPDEEEEQPAVTGQPADQTVPEGEAAEFFVVATGGGLRYQWQRNGVDIEGATDATFSLDDVEPSDGGATFRVVVTNDAGEVTSQSAALTVIPNRPPVATITTPAAGATYAGGDAFTFSGTALDPDEGELTGAAFTWEVTLHRGTSVLPFIEPFGGDTGGSFAIPVDNETAADVFYRIRLTVRDAGGLVGEAVRDVTPRKVDVTLASNVPGVNLTLDGTDVGPNVTFPSVVGIVRSLGAPAEYVFNGETFLFDGWSDGVTTPTRTLSTPNAATALTANYRTKVVAPPPPPPGPSPDLAIDAAVVQRAGSGGRATVRVSNRGQLAFNAPATLELFLSTDGTVGDDATSIATVAKTLKLKSGAGKQLKVKFLQPQVPADGSYFLVARVVPPTPMGDAANDVGASASPVVFPKPVIDFTGSVTSPVPGGVIRGGRVTTTLNLLNGGSVTANGQLGIALFAVPLGQDPTDPAGPRAALATLSPTVKVNPGAAKRVKLSFSVPTTLAPGTYTIAVQLDAANTFNESEEGNNTLVALTPLTVF
jgi:glucose/arabinose dehydrogenase